MDPTIPSAATVNPYSSLVSPGMHNMPVVNLNNIMNVKDSRWLQLEVCREFQRNKCTRPDTECKFAHPPSTVEVQNGRVTACYDSIKGRCNREKPPCKYFHPPQHLKDQLLINGRNHLALKNAFMTQIQSINTGAPHTQHTQLVHGAMPLGSEGLALYQMNERIAPTPYMTGVATMPSYNPYIGSQPVMAVGVTDAVAQSLSNVLPVPQQKIARTDRLEAFPGMGIPYKRPAPDKTGVAVYQPGSAAYHQALMQQIGGQTYVPVSCEYGGSGTYALPPPTIDGPHSPPANPSVASASLSEALPSSSVSTTTYSSSASASPNAKPTSTAASPVSTKLTALPPPNCNTAINTGASPSLPVAPVNVFSYTGYPINKGVRPTVKTQNFIPTHGATMPGAFPAGSFGGVGNVGYGLAVPGYGLPYTNNIPVFPAGASMGGIAPAGFSMAIPGMANASAGIPVQSYPLMYSQYPASSLVLPQLSALSSNPQHSWAQASEQPFKKLKTS